jgi:hypothetical protein
MAHITRPFRANSTAHPSWDTTKNTSVSRYGQWTFTVSGFVGMRAGRASAAVVTDAALGVRSNSVCIGPKRPSAKDAS